MNTGMSRMGFPCVGSWVTYGLGSENRNLPGFMVMYDSRGRGTPKSRASSWGAGFLPGIFQGTPINSSGPPIANLASPHNVTRRAQRNQLDLINQLNQKHIARLPEEEVLNARVASFELAYRLQMAAPEALDLSQETEHTTKLYGIDNPQCNEFGKQALIARRLVERGVRFVQLYDTTGGFQPWDQHAKLKDGHEANAERTDLPIAGLLRDLKQRGLLDETLVIWGGEFGRTPAAQGDGRDHHPFGFTMWMAGGGVRGGMAYGATDDLGWDAVEDPVHVHDLHATILHLLGLDHTQLTYHFAGRDYRLTDVYGDVVEAVIA